MAKKSSSKAPRKKGRPPLPAGKAKKAVNVAMDQELHVKVTDQLNDDRSLSSLIDELLRDWLSRQG